MEYRVELSDESEAELDAAYLFLLQKSPDVALRWYLGAQTAIRSLSNLPRRCSLDMKMLSIQTKRYGDWSTARDAVLTAFYLSFLTTTRKFASFASDMERGNHHSKRKKTNTSQNF